MATIVCLLAGAVGCAGQKEVNVGPQGRQHDLNVLLGRGSSGECEVKHVRPATKDGIRPGDWVFWHVTNTCEETLVRIVFSGEDPLYDFGSTSGHQALIPRGSVVLPYFGRIPTGVVERAPGGQTGESVSYKYSVVIPTDTLDPELIIDWP